MTAHPGVYGGKEVRDNFTLSRAEQNRSTALSVSVHPVLIPE